MSEPLFVDPDRLAQHGKPYESAAHDWHKLHDTVADIQARYSGAWGDDQLGSQFGPSFLQGMDSVAQQAKGTGDTLGYYSDGLVASGKVFGNAGDAADDATGQYLRDSEYVGGHDAPKGAEYFGIRSVNLDGTDPDETTPTLQRGIRSTHLAKVNRTVEEPLISTGPNGEPLESGETVEDPLVSGPDPYLPADRPQEAPRPVYQEPVLKGSIEGGLTDPKFQPVDQNFSLPAKPATPPDQGLQPTVYRAEDHLAVPAQPAPPLDQGAPPVFDKSVHLLETAQTPLLPPPAESA